MLLTRSHRLAYCLCLCLAACDDASPAKPAPQAPPEPAPAPPARATPLPEPPAPTPPAPAPEPPKKLTLDATPPKLAPVDDATKAKAAGLVGQVDGLSFPFAVASDVTNARAFLHLAHTSEAPNVVAAALRGMARTYAITPKPDAPLIDADYHAVVAYRLASPDVTIASAAFEAAHSSTDVEPPSAAVVGVLVEIAQHHESLAARYLALDALSEMSSPTGPVQGAFLQALDDASVPFVALALEEMTFLAAKIVDRAALMTRLTERLASPDAGVRGGVAEVMTQMARDDADRKELTKLLLPLLDDPHPYPRAAAAYAMGVMRHGPASAKLVAMFDDLELARFRVEGWANLEGSASDTTLMVMSGDSVASVALMALSLISTKTATPLDYAADVVYDARGHADHTAALAKGKAWYEAHQHELPSG